jgi:methylphosphotriester-DNA--protein-cysteine methyltransferase
MLAEDYSIQYMHLLLLALFKVSKYDYAHADEFIRTRNGLTYHRATCRMVTRIALKDRVALSVNDAAQRKKYRPCGLCDPDHAEEARNARIDERETQPVLIARF